ncbi:hypothetical protein EOD23_26710 [Mesorhizobium sp. USDA-HM6]|nr:hypothetical protein EOD23_26710 [Mesorhizobium sp. USDA-HM6]
MTKYAALDVSMEQTANCVVDGSGSRIAEAKVPTDPDAIADWLAGKAGDLARIGMETGPLAVWLWNELTKRALPIVCLDARHASAALSMMPNKTDRHDAAGLAQIVRTGWFREIRIKEPRRLGRAGCCRHATSWSASAARSRTRSVGYSRPSVSCSGRSSAALPVVPRKSSPVR